MKSHTVTLLAFSRRVLKLALCSLLCSSISVASQEKSADNWTNDWALEKHFSLSIDTSGYQLPTAIAFVPHPGPNPKDPLYFVTELAGKVKVVTNDRTVYTFAEGINDLKFEDNKLVGNGEFKGELEFGVAGICLAPKQGYVFITFGYYTKPDKVGRNNVMRFKTTPETFSIHPESQVAFTDVFSQYETGPSHQIGPCQVHNNNLYVSVGDGFKSPLGSQDLNNLQGKIIRMTLDGMPVKDNPFYKNDDIKEAANYVWAYGLRNPFSQKIVDGRVFVAGNGLNIDRFMEIKKGLNYLWDGSDSSISANTAYTFVPSLGPVQMDYLLKTNDVFPDEYRNKFYIAMSGAMDADIKKYPGIYLVNYDLKKNWIMEPPRYFVKYVGSKKQKVVGLAFGPGGLYFAPLFNVNGKESAILKLSYDPNYVHPVSFIQTDKPDLLMREKGCFGCHKLKDVFKQGGSKGPLLDRGDGSMVDRIADMLNSDAYSDTVKQIDSLTTEPFVNYKQARHEVLAATGINKVKTWIKYRVLEPKFDNPYTQMPNLGLSEKEAVTIANYLTSKVPPPRTLVSSIKTTVKSHLPKPRYWHILASMVIGVFIGLVLFGYFRARKS